MKLYQWQNSFQEFIISNKNKVINLIGYSYGKTTMSIYDKNNIVS